jgi:hypothetical protein
MIAQLEQAGHDESWKKVLTVVLSNPSIVTKEDFDKTKMGY